MAIARGFIFSFIKLQNFISSLNILSAAMTSAINFKDALRNDNKVFCIFKFSFLKIVYISSTSTVISYYLTSSSPTRNEEASNEIPPDENELLFSAILITFLSQSSPIGIWFILLHIRDIFRPLTTDSNYSDNFYVEWSSSDQMLPRNFTPKLMSSTELSGAPTREVITISTVASPEPHKIANNSDSNDPTNPHG